MKPLMNVLIFETRLLFRRKQRVLYSFFFPAFALVIFAQMGTEFPGYAQFVLPGLIGWMAFSNSIHAISPVLGSYKRSGVLKRVKASPIKFWKYGLGFVVSRFVLIFCSMIFLLMFGRVAYDIRIVGNPIFLFLSLFIGIISFMSIGAFISALFRSSESVGVTSQFVVYSMLFLSDAFWPTTNFPKILVFISKGLPLTQLNLLFRAALNGISISTSEIVIGITIILLWTLFCITFSVIKFAKVEE